MSKQQSRREGVITRRPESSPECKTRPRTAGREKGQEEEEEEEDAEEGKEGADRLDASPARAARCTDGPLPTDWP